jgi:hypothetical protein
MGSKDQNQSQGLHGYTGKHKRAARTRRPQEHNRCEHEKPSRNQKQETHKPHSASSRPEKSNSPGNSRCRLKYHNRTCSSRIVVNKSGRYERGCRLFIQKRSTKMFPPNVKAEFTAGFFQPVLLPYDSVIWAIETLHFTTPLSPSSIATIGMEWKGSARRFREQQK